MVVQPTPPPPLGTLIDDGSGALELVSILGCGGYGIVYRARDVNSSFPKYYAVKCLIRPNPTRPSRQRQLHLREITLHQLASPHPNVISIHRVIDPIQSPYTFLVMDYCSDGDLFSMILHKRRYLGNDALIRHVFLQLLDAVEYCHSLNIFHRDLKPENILCFDDGLTLALTDFGLATTDKVSTEFRTGSVYHMSPECQGGVMAPTGTYSPRHNDIWSLGIILLNLCTGRNPWSSATPSDPTFAAYLESPTNFLPSVLPISSHLNALLIRVFDIEPKRRPTIKEFKEVVRKMQNFYSNDVVFEGSMAKCPWEVGQNIGEDGEEVDETGYSPAASVPREHSTLPELPLPTDSLGQRTIPAKSRWSPDSVADSEMVFATPSAAEASSFASRNASLASRGTYDADRLHSKRTSHTGRRTPKQRPHLRIDIRGPRDKRRQLETPSTVARSPVSPIFNFASPPISPHSDSGGPPATPGDAFSFPRDAHTNNNGVIAVSTDSHSKSSYHTSFDDSMMDSAQPFSAISDADIVKILPSPESEQKRYEYGDYNTNSLWYSSNTPSPVNSWGQTSSTRDRSDIQMLSPTTVQETDDSTEISPSAIEIPRSDFDSTTVTSPIVTSPADTDDQDMSMEVEPGAEFDNNEEQVIPGSYDDWSPVATSGHFFLHSSPTSSTRRTGGSVAGSNEEAKETATYVQGNTAARYEAQSHAPYNPWAEEVEQSVYGFGDNLPALSSEPSWSPTELVPMVPFPTPVSVHPSKPFPQSTEQPTEPPVETPPPPLRPSTLETVEKKERSSTYAIFKFVLSRTFSPQNTQFQSFSIPRPLPNLPEAMRGPAAPTSVPVHASQPLPRADESEMWFPRPQRSSTSSSRSRSRSRTRKRVTSISSHFRFRQRTLQDIRTRPKAKLRSKSLPNSLSARNMFRTARNWFAASVKRQERAKAAAS